MVNSMPDSKSGFANAVFFAAADAGFIAGPTIWGIVADITGYQNVFIVSGAVCLATIFIQMISERKASA
jgi:MFS family permease